MFQDLVIPDNEEGHNWSSIILSLFVIGLVISGIATAVYLLGYVDELLYWKGKRMKLEEYLQGDLTPVRLPAGWITRTHFVFQADDGGLAVLDTASDKILLLVTNHTLVSPFLTLILFILCSELFQISFQTSASMCIVHNNMTKTFGEHLAIKYRQKSKPVN
jgi:hypothetical protein